MPAHSNEFRWNNRNVEQVEKHGLTVPEVQSVVRFAKHPFPSAYKRKGWRVVGMTAKKRRIEVFYFIDDDDFIYVYHAQ
jgi:hypothetical protein